MVSTEYTPTVKVYSYHHASIVSGTVRCGPSPYGILGENICLIRYETEYDAPDHDGSNMLSMNGLSVAFIHVQAHCHYGQQKVDRISMGVSIFVQFSR
jgi:hypothetical protein